MRQIVGQPVWLRCIFKGNNLIYYVRIFDSNDSGYLLATILEDKLSSPDLWDWAVRYQDQDTADYYFKADLAHWFDYGRFIPTYDRIEMITQKELMELAEDNLPY